jgi:hypothetical protein
VALERTVLVKVGQYALADFTVVSCGSLVMVSLLEFRERGRARRSAGLSPRSG